LPQQSLFSSYRVESAEGNNINVEVSIEHLLRIARIGQQARDIRVALKSKQNSPYLEFHMITDVRNMIDEIPLCIDIKIDCSWNNSACHHESACHSSQRRTIDKYKGTYCIEHTRCMDLSLDCNNSRFIL
jgi:hypothetical protein